MKKTHFLASCAVSAVILLSACQNESIVNNTNTADLQDAYLKSWIQQFGLIDPEHDWCTLRVLDVEIPADAVDGATVRIYNQAPQDGGHLIGIADREGVIRVDIPKGQEDIYAEIVDEDCKVSSQGMYAVNGNTARIDGNPTPVHASRHAHGDNNWFDAMIVCEDLGSIGDFDFNDIVLGLRYVQGKKNLYVTPMAAGGTLRAAVEFDGEPVGEIHSLINGEGANIKNMLNTHTYAIKAPTIIIPLEGDFTITEGWQRFSLKIEKDGATGAAEIITANLKEDNTAKAPQMLCLGCDWFWPKEKTSIIEAYPAFASWTNNAAVTNWCTSNNGILDNVVEWYVDQAANWFKATNSDNASFHAIVDGVYTDNLASGERHYVMPPTTCSLMFEHMYNVTAIDVAASHFDISNVNSVKGMFRSCSILTDLDVSGWDFGGKEVDMEQLFHSCSELTSVDMSSWNVVPTSTFGMFQYCPKLKSINISNLNLSKLDGQDNASKAAVMFCQTGAETLIMNNLVIPSCLDVYTMLGAGNGFTKENVIEAKNWDCTARTAGGSSYARNNNMCSWFMNMSNTTSIDVTGWNTSGVTAMENLFAYCNTLSTITGIADWDVSDVRSMSSLFSWCNFQTLDLSGWHTTEAVKMDYMFNYCQNLEYLYIDNFDMSTVQYADYMFNNCSSNLHIRCSESTKAWLIGNKDSIQLPAHLYDADSSYWLPLN